MPDDLSIRAIKALGRGLHRIARNLYLVVEAGGSNGRSWVFVYRSPLTGKRRDMGLGAADIVSVARARELALRHRITLSEGRDPLEERRQRRPAKEGLLTFRQVADLYIGAHEAAWRNPKHRTQWVSTLETYAHPVLGDVAVAEVDTGMVMRVLEGLWYDKPETASRVRGRTELVLDYAAARHWRQGGDNPARWRGHLDKLLPERRALRPTIHHAALPWPELPALWAELADCEDVSILALRLDLLTLLRTNEVRGGRWDEINPERTIWTVPGSRMKGGPAQFPDGFRVPLSTAARRVLEQLGVRRQGDYLLPGAKAGRPIGPNAMTLALHQLRPDVTVHGTVRSGFRDWAAEVGIVGEVAEACLAHAIENRVEAAYRRGDLLQPRRAALERWARFLVTPTAGTEKVVPLRREAPATG
jgi:integrase